MSDVQDESMTDAPAENGASETNGRHEEDEVEEQRISVLPGATEDAASFEFLHEDHTLGNALRYIITKNPDVELCAYTIPHPSEPKMNLRIQMYDGKSAVECLEKGLNDLMDLCDVVEHKFTIARDEFNASKKQS